MKPECPPSRIISRFARLRDGEVPVLEIPIGTTVAIAVRELIRATLAVYGSRTQAAAVLGVSRRTIYNRVPSGRPAKRRAS